MADRAWDGKDLARGVMRELRSWSVPKPMMPEDDEFLRD